MKKKFTLIFLVIFTCLYGQNTESISITLDSDQYKQLEKHFAEKEKVRMRSSDWAYFYRYEAMNDSMQKPAKVVFLGNSITDGWYRQHPEICKE